ncbi:histone chaperone RTT106-like [Eutrema salsugineum]|uniref:histone chaperone RTT106-like n=1 Tax=Eutrema salsugineum TaxID=72664 RepID=UPI000CED4CD0|nr:histone chaperone RTT106-like [Eutrema salsugineum]
MEDGEPSNTGMKDGEASNNLSEKLPKKVLGDGCYPVGARLNIYSKANVIGFLVEALKGTEDLEKLLHSQFGKLFHIPVARCCNSAKLVHALLSRQLVTTKKHEIWFFFGGQPLRYSIREFKEIIGLNCNPEPDSTEEEDEVGKTGIWKDLFGRAKAMNMYDVLEMLKDPDLPQWKRLPLALIVLVDGVLFCNSKNLALTKKYVEMLSDLDRFMLYPWGRVSFNKTVSRFQAPKAVTDAEKRENPLSVKQMVVDDGENDEQNELRWGDEVEDAEVAFMQELMAEGYKFTPSDFAVAPALIVDISDAEDEVTNEQEPEPSTRPKKKQKTHQTEKCKMQRKRGRGKNSSNLSEDETPESGQIKDLKRWIVLQNILLLREIKTELDKRLGVYQEDEEDDDVHQSKEDGEQDDEGQNTKKDGEKADEDEDEAEDGGAQSSVRHNDGVHPEDGVHHKERDDEEGTSTYYGGDHYSPRDHAYLKTPEAPTMTPEPG